MSSTIYWLYVPHINLHPCSYFYFLPYPAWIPHSVIITTPWLLALPLTYLALFFWQWQSASCLLPTCLLFHSCADVQWTCWRITQHITLNTTTEIKWALLMHNATSLPPFCDTILNNLFSPQILYTYTLMLILCSWSSILLFWGS